MILLACQLFYVKGKFAWKRTVGVVWIRPRNKSPMLIPGQSRIASILHICKGVVCYVCPLIWLSIVTSRLCQISIVFFHKKLYRYYAYNMLYLWPIEGTAEICQFAIAIEIFCRFMNTYIKYLRIRIACIFPSKASELTIPTNITSFLRRHWSAIHRLYLLKCKSFEQWQLKIV